MPSRRRTSPSASPSGAGSRGSTCVGALDDRHLAAEAADGLRHLDADRPAAEHEQPARDRLHAGHLAVRPDASSSRSPGTGGTNGSAPFARTTCSAVWRDAVDLDDARPGEPAAAAQQGDAVVREPALLARVGVVRDHEVAPGERRLDVDLRRRRRVARGVHRLARAQQRLRRDARPVGALAADELALDERDAQAALGERAGAVLARRAAADDDHVVVGSRRQLLAGLLRAPCTRRTSRASSRPPRRCASRARRAPPPRAGAPAPGRSPSANDVAAGSTRPGSRVVTSWSSQPLPSGSLNVANEP